MNDQIVLDVETQFTFQEVGYDYRKLKVAVVGVYDYQTSKYQIYREEDLNKLFNRMEHASKLIGFNIRKFDLPVLSPYYLGNIEQFEVLDLLQIIYQNLGFRLALDDLARSTLGVKKTGHGFLAIEYFRSGDFQKLEEYCLHDVKITKELYEYAQKHGKLIFQTHKGNKEIPIDLTDKKNNKTVSLSLPF